MRRAYGREVSPDARVPRPRTVVLGPSGRYESPSAIFCGACTGRQGCRGDQGRHPGPVTRRQGGDRRRRGHAGSQAPAHLGLATLEP